MADITLTRWDDTGSATDKFEFTTKAYDFGTSSEFKNISKIFVTVKNLLNADVLYTAAYRTSTKGSFTTLSRRSSDYTTDDQMIDFSPLSPIRCKLFQLKISVNQLVSDDEFYINDISIIFRPLRGYSTEKFETEIK
tara:strand:- start:420 stop:830 length:411 start_codon:yes stop_codon:yes gene_type:complete